MQSLVSVLLVSFLPLHQASYVSFDEDPTLANPDLEEGDIIPKPVPIFPHGVALAANLVVTSKWDDATVLYDISSLPHEGQKAFKKAVKKIMSVTCVKFRAKQDGDKYWVNVRSDRTGCYSYVGVLRSDADGRTPPGGQELMLSPSCWKSGIIEHELMHVLGFYHEHSRYDRDSFIHIAWENIAPGKESQFRIRRPDEVDLQNLPYDYKSVLHYKQNAFSANGFTTIKTTDPKYQDVIGQRKGLSRIDVLRINLWYSCPIKEDEPTNSTTTTSTTTTTTTTATTPSPSCLNEDDYPDVSSFTWGYKASLVKFQGVSTVGQNG